MKKCLVRIKNEECVYHYVNCNRVEGVPDGITGNLTGIRGNLSGITGDLTGISGDIDDAGLTDYDRKRGVRVDDLVMEMEGGS